MSVVDYSKNVFELWVSVADPLKFMDIVVSLANKGAVLKAGTMPRLRGVPLTAKLEVTTSSTSFLEKPIIGVLEIPKKVFYDRDTLEGMTFEDFREACRYAGITGRDRTQMMREYMLVVHKQEEELSKPVKVSSKTK